MNHQTKSAGRRKAAGGLPAFNLRPLAVAVITCLELGAISPLWAAEQPSLNELQAEIARLKAALQKSEQQFAERNGGSAPIVADAAPAASEDASNPAQLETVVVRRQSVVEKLQKDTRSISAVSGEDLERLGATNITEVLRRVGNVQFNYGNPRTGSLTMRGITTGSSDQIDPSVGAVLDGVSLGYTPLVNGYPFVDIDTVEVRRGPQGSQGGKQASVGQIAFSTKAPRFTPEAEVSITAGEWNTLNTTAIAGGPIVDGVLAWRGTFRREQSDGPWKNQFPDLKGRSSYQNVDRNFGRLQFLLTPTEDFSAKLSIEHQPNGAEFVNGLSYRHPEPAKYSDGVARPANLVDQAYKKYQRSWFTNSPTTWNPATDYYGIPVALDNNGAIITGSRGETLNLEWNIAGHTLQSITGHRSHWFSAANDEGSPYDITKSGGYITDYSQVSQEFKLLSERGGSVDYLAGLFFMSTDNDSLTRTRYGNDAGAYQAGNAPYANLVASGTGQAMLRDSLNLAYRGTDTLVKNRSIGVYGKADWHLSEPLTLSTGYRITQENRRTQQELALMDAGVGADFTTAFGTAATPTLLPGDVPAGDIGAANRLAERYFGAGSTFAGLSGAQRTQLLQAAAIRNGTLQPANFYGFKSAPTWSGNIRSWDGTLTHKFDDSLSVFGSLQYGEKGGMAQIASNGSTASVDKESTRLFEVGFRASSPAKDLFVNANLFLSDIKDFQTTVYEYDSVLTAQNVAGGNCSGADCTAYSARVGNLPGVRVKGLEIDAAYSGLKNFNLRAALAYNDARYSKDTYLPFVNERNPEGLPSSARYYNAKGEVLNNAPKFSAKLGVDYRVPVFSNKVFYATGNYTYYTKQQTSPSAYDQLPAYGILDLGIGLSRQDGLFDVSLVAKNALNEDAHVAGWSSYTPRLPRWIGLTFNHKI
ncbi:MAG: TonB-dependent receptor [Dechloromonas sp.]|nr:TonB-dependent receptor [Dechloromonas sp.]